MRTIGLVEESPKTPKAPVKKAKKPTSKKEEAKPDGDAE